MSKKYFILFPIKEKNLKDKNYKIIFFILVFFIIPPFAKAQDSKKEKIVELIENHNQHPLKQNINEIKNSIKETINEKSQKSKDKISNNSTKNQISEIISSIIDPKEKTFSLMLTDDEIINIKKALKAYKNNEPLYDNRQESNEKGNKEISDNAKSHIYLGSILYKSPSNWSLWINNQKISSQNNRPENEIYIKEADQEKADILWTMPISKWKVLTNNDSEENAPINEDNKVAVSFSLKFNQTYMLNGGRIIEGKISSLTNTKNELENNQKGEINN